MGMGTNCDPVNIVMSDDMHRNVVNELTKMGVDKT